MSKAIQILKYLIVCLMIVMATACAPAKNPYAKKKKAKSSHVGSEQLGRNRYYFSPGYQKKLNSNYKKK
jgi:hypothetical protein